MFLHCGLAVFAGFSILSNVHAQTPTSGSSNPGCYASCRYLWMDYQPLEMRELCNQSTSLGSLFFINVEDCANCVRTNNGLSSYFDKEDAEEAITVMDFCQSAIPMSRKEMVSAISIISKYGHLAGTTATPISTVAPVTSKSPTTTHSPTTQSTSPVVTPVDENPHSEDRAWIAGPVVGSVAGVALVVVAAIFVMKRHKQHQSTKAVVDVNNESGRYEKAELPAEGNTRHELASQNTVELDSEIGAQELASREVWELPGEGKR
ncbi:hypothetical protein N7445_001479 [Penicillium cf. griseofulvum]|nr:hypothetical protein N7445_001479 [Penicillium cf. griseofulvum]